MVHTAENYPCYSMYLFQPIFSLLLYVSNVIQLDSALFCFLLPALFNQIYVLVSTV